MTRLRRNSTNGLLRHSDTWTSSARRLPPHLSPSTTSTSRTRPRRPPPSTTTTHQTTIRPPPHGRDRAALRTQGRKAAQREAQGKAQRGKREVGSGGGRDSGSVSLATTSAIRSQARFYASRTPRPDKASTRRPPCHDHDTAPAWMKRTIRTHRSPRPSNGSSTSDSSQTPLVPQSRTQKLGLRSTISG